LIDNNHINKAKRKKSRKKKKKNKANKLKKLSKTLPVVNVTGLQTVVVHIGKTSTKALVDSGSQINVIKEETYIKAKLDQKYSMRESETPLVTSISGATVRVLGKTMIPITVGGITLNTELYIIRRIKYSIILGLQFLQDANAKINFHNSQLLLQHGISTVQLNHI
jgi:hypothetical protein